MTTEAPYSLELTDRAKETLRRLDKTVARRIEKRLDRLANNATSILHIPLKRGLQGLYKLRIGDYRAIYRLEREMRLIVVEAIGHRRDVYKG
jgi:mRNA interferase RelE/StbE